MAQSTVTIVCEVGIVSRTRRSHGLSGSITWQEGEFIYDYSVLQISVFSNYAAKSSVILSCVAYQP